MASESRRAKQCALEDDEYDEHDDAGSMNPQQLLILIRLQQADSTGPRSEHWCSAYTRGKHAHKGMVVAVVTEDPDDDPNALGAGSSSQTGRLRIRPVESYTDASADIEAPIGL